MARRLSDRERRFREGQKRLAAELRQAKRSGVVAGIRPLVSGDACPVCRAVRDAVFPIETCTVEQLPPYQDCEHEDGCDSCITEVLKPEYSGQPTGGTRVRIKPLGWLVIGGVVLAIWWFWS